MIQEIATRNDRGSLDRPDRLKLMTLGQNMLMSIKSENIRIYIEDRFVLTGGTAMT